MLNLYGNPLSSPTNKVRYVANYLNISYDFHIINIGAGEQRNPEFLKINSFGRIPAIDDNGFTLAESNAIIRYLADKNNSSLYPRELQQRARVDQWMDYAAQHIAIPTSKIMFNTYYYKFLNMEKDERSLQDGYHFLERNLPAVEQQLKQHAYIAGDTMTIADIAMLAALDVCELSKVDLTVHSNLNAWRTKLMNEAFYQRCHKNYTETFNKAINN
jgi:glutathione S-transferase